MDDDNKVSVEEALNKLYDLSWMVGSTAMEYLTDKDGEICYALLKSGNKLTDQEQKIFDNYRKTGQLEMMSDDNIDDWEDTK